MPLGPNTVVDEFRSFPDGMNAGIDPAELPKTQLGMLVNGTVRGSFVSDRPPFQLLGVTGDNSWEALLFQGACYYKPDSGPEQIVAQIGGNVYAFTPGYGTVAAALLKSSWNPAQLTQAWLWQAEKWLIGNDGQSLPWWYDGTQVVRSGGTGQIAIIPGALSILAVGQAQTIVIHAWTSVGGDLGADSYKGPFSVPVDIVDVNGTGLSIGQFEIQQNSQSSNGTLAGVAPGSGTGATNGAGQTLPAGTNLSVPVPNTAWTAHTTAAVTAAAGTTTKTTNYNTAVSASSNAGGGNIGYLYVNSTANITAGQSINVGGTSLIVSSVTSGTVLAIQPTANGWSFGAGVSVTWSITVTTTTPQPTSITIPLSSAFPGGNTLFVTSGATQGNWPVISYGEVNGVNTVTVAITQATTFASGVSVTNNPTPGSYWQTVATLAAQAVVPGSGTVTISTVAVYTGASQTVYATVNGTIYSFTLVGTAPTTVISISLYPVSLNTGVTSAAAGAAVILSNQLPVGKMGAYIRDRNYIALPDGLSFTVSDAAGESSGSVGNQFRDAVLFCNDINQLTTGLFRVPGGSGGAIQFFAPSNQLDASLGQGPGQVGTPQGVFSVNLPDDSTQWQTSTTPLLTQSIIGGGAAGAWSAVSVNNDLFYRASDGSIRSLNLARQDFNTWGQVPCSKEVASILAQDSATLLPWCSGVAFDNRLLMTTGLTQGTLGVYGTKTVAINFDRISSLAGKAPSVWDGVWTGLNVLQYITGSFGGVLRCFAFQFNTISGAIEIWEVLPSPPKPQTGPVSPYAVNDYATTGYNSTALLYGGATAQAVATGGTIKSVGGTNAIPAVVPRGATIPASTAGFFASLFSPLGAAPTGSITWQEGEGGAIPAINNSAVTIPASAGTVTLFSEAFWGGANDTIPAGGTVYYATPANTYLALITGYSFVSGTPISVNFYAANQFTIPNGSKLYWTFANENYYVTVSSGSWVQSGGVWIFGATVVPTFSGSLTGGLLFGFGTASPPTLVPGGTVSTQLTMSTGNNLSANINWTEGNQLIQLPSNGVSAIGQYCVVLFNAVPLQNLTLWSNSPLSPGMAIVNQRLSTTGLSIESVISSSQPSPGLYETVVAVSNSSGNSYAFLAGDLIQVGSGSISAVTSSGKVTALVNSTTLLYSLAAAWANGPSIVTIGTTNCVLYNIQNSGEAGSGILTLLTPSQFTPNVGGNGVGDVLNDVTNASQPSLTITGITSGPTNLGNYWSVTVSVANYSATPVTLAQGDLVQDVPAGGSGSLTYGNGGSPAPAIGLAVTLASFGTTPTQVSLSNPWTVGPSIVQINGQSYLLFQPVSVGSVTNLVPIKTRLETGRMLGAAAPAGAGGTARAQSPQSKRPDQICMLTAGELYFKDLQDDITITVYWRPDYSWDWQVWRSWTIPFQPNQASFCRAVGLGEPPNNSDPTTNRPWRQFYHCYLAIEITGHATLMGGRVYAELQPTAAFAPMNPVN